MFFSAPPGSWSSEEDSWKKPFLKEVTVRLRRMPVKKHANWEPRVYSTQRRSGTQAREDSLGQQYFSNLMYTLTWERTS
eukprot:5692993-Amphidinium_carterae.1